MPIPDNIVENLRETDKVIMTDADSIKFKSKIYTEKCVHSKPKGLWYGMGDSWIDWVRHEMPTWECNNLFKLDLDESKIINDFFFSKFRQKPSISKLFRYFFLCTMINSLSMKTQ